MSEDVIAKRMPKCIVLGRRARRHRQNIMEHSETARKRRLCYLQVNSDGHVYWGINKFIRHSMHLYWDLKKPGCYITWKVRQSLLTKLQHGSRSTNAHWNTYKTNSWCAHCKRSRGSSLYHLESMGSSSTLCSLSNQLYLLLAAMVMPIEHKQSPGTPQWLSPTSSTI